MYPITVGSRAKAAAAYNHRCTTAGPQRLTSKRMAATLGPIGATKLNHSTLGNTKVDHSASSRTSFESTPDVSVATSWFSEGVCCGGSSARRRSVREAFVLVNALIVS